MGENELNNKKQNKINSLLRAANILEIISDNGEAGIAELSRKMNLSKSTIYRLISTLEEAGFLFQNPTTKKYYCSLKLFRLGKKAFLQNDLRSLVNPYLKKLMSEVKETAVLGTLDNGDVIYLDKAVYPQEIQLPSFVGNRSPVHCTGVGKAILAHLPENEQIELLQNKELKAYTKNTITNLDELFDDLKQIYKRGYSISNEERIPGTVAIAVPLRNYKGEVIAAIAIHGFINQITPDRIEPLGNTVLKTSREINELLGFFENDN